jgi:hypothetical protein
MVLNPYPGGGEYGKCCRCHRGGLVVTKIPEPVVKKPVGWTKVPER